MKQQALHQIQAELIAAGAAESEIGSLLKVVRKLNRLKHLNSPPSHAVYRRVSVRLTAFAVLAIGILFITVTQNTLPGSWLYPIQTLSDNVAISLHPEYRSEVMMKRAQEVRQLVANRASLSLVLATLADYKAVAATYRAAPANYAAFENCKQSLQQAAAIAPAPERQAINNSLLSLNNV